MSRKSKRAKLDSAANPSAKKTKKTKRSGRQAWKMMDRASTVVAGMVAQRATSVVWRAATGKKPPVSSQHPELGKVEAVAWAVFVGAGVELSKMLIHRATADYWVKSTGHLPPGMRPLERDKKPAGTPAESPAGDESVRSRNRGK